VKGEGDRQERVRVRKEKWSLFEVAVKECQLPAQVVAAARHQAQDLQCRLATEDEPVVAAGWGWLDGI